jgi:beta-glucosidase-like glycosyl hydrolase
MQGSTDDGNGYLKTITTCKHFAGFNSGFNLGSNQDQGFNALIDDRDMADTYLPAFRACITQAKGASVMCSYNAINGVPSCANKWLLDDVLRKEYRFDGHVVSDCGGVADAADPRFPKNETCLQKQATPTAPEEMNQTTSDCWCRDGECGQTISGM